MIVAATGHRPMQLRLQGHDGYSGFISMRAEALARAMLRKLKATKVISGMALGWDTAVANASLDLGLPLVAAIPCHGQEKKWTRERQAIYHAILARAAEVITISTWGYDGQVFQKRNEWMVDHCQVLLALWNGRPGGTGNCIGYAQRQGREVVNCWESWVKYALNPD